VEVGEEVVSVDVKRLVKHSTIYGIGNILTKVGAFLMVPIYTRYLTTSEYGSLELFYVTAGVLRSFLSMGIAHATLRFFFEYDDVPNRQRVIGTALLSSGFFSLILLGVFFQFTEFFSTLFFKTPNYSYYFKLVAIMFALELSIEISTAYIRAIEYSIFYIAVCLGQLLVRIALNSYMIVILKCGVQGILVGDLIATAMSWVAYTAITVRFSGLCFESAKLREMLTYSYPLALASISGVIFNNADRYLLNAYSSLGTIGLYALAYRFGTALQALYTEPFTKSYGPFRFSIMKRPDAQVFYARIMTYFLLGFMFLGLGISVLSEDIIRIMASRTFWGAHSVVPIIVLASAGGGAYYLLQIGIYVRNQTKYVPIIFSVVGGINIVCNSLLIPRIHMYGAACSYLITNVVLCGVTYVVSQRFLPIKYEIMRISKMFLVAGIIYFGCAFLLPSGSVLGAAVKISCVLLFPLILYVGGFFYLEEIEFAKGEIRKLWLYVAGKFAEGRVKI